MTEATLQFDFDNSVAAKLEGCYVRCEGDVVPAPEIVALNRPLAIALNLDPDALDSPEGAAILTGGVTPTGAEPLAQVYAGHQFGGFAPQLGDGRALLIGEIIDDGGIRRDIQLKGSGRTPFSRHGDGKAVLAPVLREYLIAEAMHALGIPTTRALAAVVTGEKIMRENLQPGAVLTRVAASHIRVGTLQYFAAKGEVDKVRQLADYAISRHYPELIKQDTPYLGLLRAVGERHAGLVAKWMHVGFVHGVMNTDNMTISGETIDYGPCAFMDNYDPNAVYSSIDYMGRYAYANQPLIAQWNLARLGETLLPLIDPDDSDHAVQLVTAEVENFENIYEKQWLSGMRKKIGLATNETGDAELIKNLLAAMTGQGVDFTLFFRRLAAATGGDDAATMALFDDAKAPALWLNTWRRRLARDTQSEAERKLLMNSANPMYIPRNYHVESVLRNAVQTADFSPFKELLSVLSQPYQNQLGKDTYAEPPPEDFGRYQTFCGT